MRWLQPLWAELCLGWYRAIRGPLVVALVAILFFFLFGLPYGAEEPTAALGYGIGLSWTVLLVCALWCGVASYAYDRERHRMTLVLTKPIHRWTLWFGRWMGTSVPFLCVMCLFYGGLLTRDIPEGLHQARPMLESVETIAKRELEAMRVAGLDTLRMKKEEGVSEARLLKDLRHHILTRYTELTEETPLIYTFEPLPRGTKEAVFCLSGIPFMGAYESTMMSLTASYDETTVTLPIMITSRGVEAPLPEAWVMSSTSPLTITMRRQASFEEAGYIMFREREDIQLFYSGYSASLNLMVVVSVMMIVVLMATALGCSLGALFSLPVGLFVGTLCLIAAAVASVDITVTITQELRSFWMLIGSRVSDIVAGPFTGIVDLDPLTRLSKGISIQWQEVGRFICTSFVPWVFICSLSAWISSVKDENR